MIIDTVMGTAISFVGMYSSGPTISFLIWVSLDENVEILLPIHLFSSIALLHSPNHPAPPAQRLIKAIASKVKVKVVARKVKVN